MNLSALAKSILCVHLAQAILPSAVPSLNALAFGREESERARPAKTDLAKGEEPGFSQALHDFAVRLSAKQPVTHTGGGQATAERIAQLIAQLGSDRYAERSQAQKSLAKIGLPARPALLAASRDKDAERAQRAKEILAGLALSRENWPTEWDAMTFSFGVKSADPAKCLEVTIDAQRRAVVAAWNAASKSVTTTEAVLSPKDLQPLWVAFGRLRPWTLNKMKQWPADRGSGMIALDITVENQFVNIAQPWPPTSTVKTAEYETVMGGLMQVHYAAMHLADVVQRESAIQAQSRQAGKVNEPVKTNPITAASIPRAGTTSRPTGELYGDERQEAFKARDATDRARAEYETTYPPYDRNDKPLPPEAEEKFAKVEKLYQKVIEKYSLTDIGGYCRECLAGAYHYRGQHDKAEALKQEAEEARAAVTRLNLEQSNRRAAKDWPELAALCRLLRLPWQEQVTRDDLRAATAKLGARADEAIDRLMEDFWSLGDYAYRWRTIQVLGIVYTPRSREALLQVALRTRTDELPWIRGAAREYVAILPDKSEARKLLAANDTEVLQQAAAGLRGVAIDKDMIGRLLELMGSKDHHLRRAVAVVLGEDPGGQFASEKVAAIVRAIPDIAHMEKADDIAWPGSWTNSEVYCRTYIDALARMKNARQAITKQLADAPAGEPMRHCLVLALAFGGDGSVRPELRKMLTDAKMGLFRAWTVEALGNIGTTKDLPLLRDVAQKDSMQREQGGCRAPMNKQMYYPVRQAAQRAIELLEQAGKRPASPASS